MNLQEAFLPLVTKRSTQPTTVSSAGLFGFGSVTKNGVVVSEKSALTLSAFYNGIEIITNDFAKLPKAVFQKIENSRIKLNNHPVQYLIATKPNQYMTSFMFDKVMLQYTLLKGNAYAYIERDNNAQPIALQIIDQDLTPVEVIKHNSKLYYHFGNKTLSADDMVHVPGFSFNGITGIGVVTHAANSIGVSLSSQEFSTDYYNKKGIGKGVLTAASNMDADAKIRYSKAMSEALSQNNSDFGIAIADEMNAFQHIRISPQESQFLLTNKYGIEEVARWLNIPPNKLKSLDNVNNSITENNEIQHVSDSIVPHARKFEQEYNAKLFTKKEQLAGIYVKANEAALLRADKKTQAEFLSKMVNSKVMTPNEARAILEMNNLPEGDELLQPVNLQTESQFQQKLDVTKKNNSNE